MAVLLRGQAQAIYEEPDKETDLRPCRATLQVKLVQDQEKVGIRITVDPLPSLVENRGVHFSGQHRAQHAHVGDKNMRQMFLHVPARTISLPSTEGNK